MSPDEFEEDDAPGPATAIAAEAEDERAQQLRLIEALLFASAAPLDEAALAERVPKDTDIQGLLAQLGEDYRGRGVNLVFVAGGWTFHTAPDLAGRLKLEKIVARKLSRAGIETLAIVAYHQPVTRAEIEDIRGVAINKGTLDVLMETGWIAPMGRRETPGRPITWGVTDAFLLHFGLADRSDLPGIEELKATGLIGPRVAVLSEGAPFRPPEELPQRDEPEEETEPDELLAEDNPAANADGE
jgi:segregation and condensation protein B